MRKVILIILILALVFSLSGCWDAKDLGNLEIPIAGAYDKNGRNVVVTSISPNLSSGVTKRSRTDIYSGFTVGETRNLRSAQTPREILIGMIQVTIFGEEMAKDGQSMKSIVDLYLRNPQAPGYSVMAVTEGPAQKVLSAPTEDFQDTGMLITDLLRIAPKNSFVLNSSLHVFGRETGIKGENPVLPLIKNESGKPTISGSALFHGYKMIGKLNRQETRALVILRGDKPTGYIPFVIQKDGIVIDKGTVLVVGSRKVKVQRQGDEFNFQVKINLQGNLVEHTSQTSLLGSSEALKDIEKQIQSNVENECRQLIDKMQNVYGFDFIKINQYALAKWRPELTGVIDNPEFFQNVNINVEVKVQIRNIGEIS